MLQDRSFFFRRPQRPAGSLLSFLGSFPAPQMAFLMLVEAAGSRPAMLFLLNIS